MNIRRAEEKDMDRINDLLFQVCLVHHKGRPDLFKYGAKKYTDEQLLAIIQDDQRPIFVAEDSDQVVQGYAFCIFSQHIDDNILTDIKTLYIDDLCVDQSLRGQHIGESLFEFVKAEAKRLGCYEVTLNVWAGNTSAEHFYEKMGMKTKERQMEYILK